MWLHVPTLESPVSSAASECSTKAFTPDSIGSDSDPELWCTVSGTPTQRRLSVFVTAKAVGASHKRERVFVLAYRPGERLLWDAEPDERTDEREQQPPRRGDAGGCDSDVGHDNGAGNACLATDAQNWATPAARDHKGPDFDRAETSGASLAQQTECGTCSPQGQATQLGKSCAARETRLWRSLLQRRLSSMFGD